jgi:hypothetical protein
MISHATVERLGQRSGLVLVVEDIARPGHWRGTTTVMRLLRRSVLALVLETIARSSHRGSARRVG